MKNIDVLRKQILKEIKAKYSLVRKYPKRECSVYINKKCNCKKGQCDNLMY